MGISEETRKEIREDLIKIVGDIAGDRLEKDYLKSVCERLNIIKVNYCLEFTGDDRYRIKRFWKPGLGNGPVNTDIVVYDSSERAGVCFEYSYRYREGVIIHSFQTFRLGISEDSLDKDFLRFLADFIFLVESRSNMRSMLDFAENSDGQTGIPNIVSLTRKYSRLVEEIPPDRLILIRVNLQKFKYVNDSAGARTGDEAIVMYARKLLGFFDEDEGVCRLGGDNFVAFFHKEHYDVVMERLKCVILANLKSAPGMNFEISPWIGVSILEPGENRSFLERLNDASTACDLAKTRFRKSVVVYDKKLEMVILRSRDIVSWFRPAVTKHEFHPFFQAKVDMISGKVIGFETLCRWFHEGGFIYPDQFIPVLDRNSLIPELDFVIFEESCAAVRQWKTMGLNPPRVSTNFSKKDLFVPGVEDRILNVIDDYGLTTGDMEVEITESVQESEYERLIEFVRYLKGKGLHISVDDFGTGYSSLSLIHNIEADVIKIDKSFVSRLPEDGKATILIDSIVGIAKRLGMDVIAEGVEDKEQARALIKLGCTMAQGFYFSRPVDFDAATNLLENPPDFTIREE